MQIETLKDVLHWTKEFHQHLNQCLSHCADKNTDERARMILAYLSEHEKTPVSYTHLPLPTIYSV